MIGLKTRAKTNYYHYYYYYYGFIIISFSLIIFSPKQIICSAKNNGNSEFYRSKPYEQSQIYNFDTTKLEQDQDDDLLLYGSQQNNVIDKINPFRPTPPLEISNNYRLFRTLPYSQPCDKPTNRNKLIEAIQPTNIVKRHVIGPDQNLSPIADLQTINFGAQQQPEFLNDAQIGQAQDSPFETSNSFDIVEPGSGSGPDSQSSEEPMLEHNESGIRSNIQPSPVVGLNFGTQMTPTVIDRNNMAPSLTRKLPKLVATAGQVWRYAIPTDSFIDEDGDLKHLKSMISLKRSNSFEKTNKISSDSDQPFDNYLHWLQYDQNLQTLYGLPTEQNIGKHEYVLTVTDHKGSSTSETIEIIVRQHPSTRAFTHSFTINRIDWDHHKYQSTVDALSDLIRRITTQVFDDYAFKNFIALSYTIQKPQSSTNPVEDMSINLPISLVWSNSSIPIHPCNLSSLEYLIRMLINPQQLPSDWSLENGEKISLPPSQSLIKALEPSFRPSNISVQLLGACEGKDKIANDVVQSSSAEFDFRVRIKIGKLNWKLGEPIEYRIPDDIFEADKGSRNTRNMSLMVHTIDGLSLEKDTKYSFLEFNQENQTLYGLPYDIVNHKGQKELILTAIHPMTNVKIREVFIVNIELEDLTTINNRAFRMSLYFVPRANLFGPRERVALGHKIVAALGVDDIEFHHDRENPEFTVIDIQKFVSSSFIDNFPNQNNPSDNSDGKIKLFKVDDIIDGQTDEFYDSREFLSDQGLTSKGNIFYKFTWTNETIGYRGDCPVEVIKENILKSLERSMLEFNPSNNAATKTDDSIKSDSNIFYEKLVSYFEPDLDLIHLRFEPLSACIDALELHDVGENALADQIDRSNELPLNLELDIPQPNITLLNDTKKDQAYNSDEYWSILVLIVLVVALIFVMMMFFMGMHTYKINQEKRFELQVKLAQARQNSMYLSSMVLSDQAAPSDIVSQMMPPGTAKSMYIIQDEDRSSHKPVILESEKNLWTGNLLNTNGPKPTAVQLKGQTIQTRPFRPNMTFTLDSIVSMQNSITSNNFANNMPPYYDPKQHSMTLNRRPSSIQQRMMFRQGSTNSLNHSQSILTVASLAGPMQMMPQAQFPMMYTTLPVVCESNAETTRES